MWQNYFRLKKRKKLWIEVNLHSNLQMLYPNQFIINNLQTILNSGGMVHGYNYRF